MNSYQYIEQLFKNVLITSKSIQGRLYVCPMWGVEINSDTLGELIQNEIKHIQGNKYPLALMMPPRSKGKFTIASGEWEDYAIDMFFLQTSYYAANQVKSINPATRTSTYPVSFDWSDMHTAASNFIAVLNKVQILNNLINTTFRVSSEQKNITPVSNIGVDRASGVRLQFPVSCFVGCVIEDYDDADIPQIPTNILTDIEFSVGDAFTSLGDPAPQGGESFYQNNNLIGVKIRLVRNHISQGIKNDGSGYWYSFDTTKGKVLFYPNLVKEEYVQIQIY
jgi:hypothetical protein